MRGKMPYKGPGRASGMRVPEGARQPRTRPATHVAGRTSGEERSCSGQFRWGSVQAVQETCACKGACNTVLRLELSMSCSNDEITSRTLHYNHICDFKVKQRCTQLNYDGACKVKGFKRIQAWGNFHTPRDRSVCPYALGDYLWQKSFAM